MYVAVSETFKDPTAEPRLEPVKKGPFDNDNELMAVAKLAQPLETSQTTDTTILINIDR